VERVHPKYQWDRGNLRAVPLMRFADSCMRDPRRIVDDQSINSVITRPEPPTLLAYWFAAPRGECCRFPDTWLPRAHLEVVAPETERLEVRPNTWEDRTVYREYEKAVRLTSENDEEQPVEFLGGSNQGIIFYDFTLAPGAEKIPKGAIRVMDIMRMQHVEKSNEEENGQHSKVWIKVQLPQSLRASLRTGMVACAFDESIGRLVVATADSDLIHVLDFVDHIGIEPEEPKPFFQSFFSVI